MIERTWIDDQIGNRFGQLVVLGIQRNDKGKFALVQCDCGSEILTRPSGLKSGNSTTCGNWKKHDRSTRTHGLSKSKEFGIWKQMHQRCSNPRCKNYKNYGARSIAVCERWGKFENFYADMGPRPIGRVRYTVERNDTGGNYEPGNCRWATYTEQLNNTRRNRIIEFRGERLNITQWATKLGINRIVLDSRIKRGMPLERALTAVIYQKRPGYHPVDEQHESP